ncbi:hypothetical protein GN157_15160 [Flavobacterium rakeshii]|uniref:Bowman-Birk serine protease inhibitors family domain-containing protein n=1 Tax=Flavobacterium rakeshii TaxID=1038845 RepID=A0A6N8HH31_9FLAO|nr:hypothetical protein [Flavobacterium rakeshii]
MGTGKCFCTTGRPPRYHCQDWLPLSG